VKTIAISLNTKVICSVSEVNRSTYYNVSLSGLDKDTESLELVRNIFYSRKERIGIRQIKMLLWRKKKVLMNLKKIARIKKKYGLITKIRKKNKNFIFLKKQQEHKVASNVVNRVFKTDSIDKIYSTDITQFNLRTGQKCYLAAFKDLGTKEIVSFKMSMHPGLNFVLEGLKESIKTVPVDKRANLIIHSDQGFHFTHYDFSRIIKESGATQSMSRKGNCLDNAPIESFFGYLKDHINLKDCESFKDLEDQVTKEINYYNNDRPQWDLKKMPPIEYRRHLLES
jgi:transposase InsO family protein